MNVKIHIDNGRPYVETPNGELLDAVEVICAIVKHDVRLIPQGLVQGLGLAKPTELTLQ